MAENNNIWRDRADEFMDVRHLSQERSLHPFVVNLIKSIGGKRLLDYGCGDGRILNSLPKSLDIDVYDPSAQMRTLAHQRAGDRIKTMFAESADIKDTYDIVLLGMVLLCLPNEEEVHRTLSNCATAMAHGAHLVLTSSHPCFRNQSFSNFKTEYSQGEEFNYLDNGRPFEVTISDSQSVTFTDYHWSLDFTFKALKANGLLVEQLFEIADDQAASSTNYNAPAFLVLDCVRNL